MIYTALSSFIFQEEVRMEHDLEKVRTFFDAHPGFAGAMIPIPPRVKKVADELDGAQMTLREAVTKIKAVTKGIVSVSKDFIYLELGNPGGLQHSFRVICFK